MISRVAFRPAHCSAISRGHLRAIPVVWRLQSTLAAPQLRGFFRHYRSGSRGLTLQSGQRLNRPLPIFTPSNDSLVSRFHYAKASLATKATHHSAFYFDETPVVIKVENVVFKVHKYHLLQSETFSDMFKVPQADKSVEGATPENPIVLNGVTAVDFEALLTVLHARRCSNVQEPLTPSLIVSAYRLAHMWNFSDLRTYLLTQAENILDDAEKIDFAKKFGLKNWLMPAYLNLCRRAKPLTASEATKLGLDDVWMISRSRERYHNRDSFFSYNRSVQTNDSLGNDVRQWVEDGRIFRD